MPFKYDLESEKHYRFMTVLLLLNHTLVIKHNVNRYKFAKQMSATIHPVDQSNEIRNRATSFTVPLEVSRRVYTQEKFDDEFEYVANVTFCFFEDFFCAYL
jgi:hypothetical protein